MPKQKFLTKALAVDPATGHFLVNNPLLKPQYQMEITDNNMSSEILNNSDVPQNSIVPSQTAVITSTHSPSILNTVDNDKNSVSSSTKTEVSSEIKIKNTVPQTNSINSNPIIWTNAASGIPITSTTPVSSSPIKLTIPPHRQAQYQ